ncbi:MAG: SMP-30/gluconolactonase/LRE family protein [Ilumatobacteraceae bacterium]
MTYENVEIVLDGAALLGEGPSWSASDGRLLWVDIERHELHRLDPGAGSDDCYDLGARVSFALATDGEDIVVGLPTGVSRFADGTLDPEPLVPIERERTGSRLNDGKCDSIGRIWAGTISQDLRPGQGSLYRIDSELRAERLLTGLSVSNGLGWSPCGRWFYLIDSPTFGVEVHDVDDDGSLRNRRRLIDIDPAAGKPDGMTVDADGRLWIALWGSGTVQSFRPDGTPDIAVAVPTSNVTSCTFGGDALDTLYVTSARLRLTDAQLHDQPHAGAVFAINAGVVGLPTTPFSGQEIVHA